MRVSPHLSQLVSNPCKAYARTSSIASSSRCPFPGTTLATSRPSNRRDFSSGERAGSSFRAQRAHSLKISRLNKRSFHTTLPNAANKNPYQVLGVAKDASASEIKKRYYELARKHHPDSNKDPASKDKFVEIQAAWDILSDEKKRAAYDQYGAASQQQGFDPNAFSAGAGGFGGFPGFGANPFGGGGPGGPQADLFETLFGGGFGGGSTRGGRSAGPSRGEDLEATINVSFVEACKGTSKSVNTTPIVDCHTCEGSGLKKGQKRTTCRTCNGTGTQTFVISSGFHMAGTCPTCQGTGSIVPKGAQCEPCDGLGKVKERKSVKVEVPSGVEDGMVIRVPRAGDMPISSGGAREGAPGDLLVRVNVTPSKVFRRQGTNLYVDAKIPLTSALLGGKARIPTLDGDVDLRVPSGTQPGQEATLKGRGVPNVYNRTVGDLIVSFTVQLPRSLTARQKAILQEFADDLEGRRPDLTSSGSGSSSAPSSSSESAHSTSTPPSDTNFNAEDETPSEGGKANAVNDNGESTTEKSGRPSDSKTTPRTEQRRRSATG